MTRNVKNIRQFWIVRHQMRDVKDKRLRGERDKHFH